MGPLSKQPQWAHRACQQRENCTGPGCRVQTGKTERRNHRHENRLRVLKARKG